jgi:hypothetical protein
MRTRYDSYHLMARSKPDEPASVVCMANAAPQVSVFDKPQVSSGSIASIPPLRPRYVRFAVNPEVMVCVARLQRIGKAWRTATKPVRCAGDTPAQDAQDTLFALSYSAVRIAAHKYRRTRRQYCS